MFPIGNWDSYALWQFSSGINCGKRRCPYRVPGTLDDIDVNVAAMSSATLRPIWAGGALLPEKALPLVLIARADDGVGAASAAQATAKIESQPLLISRAEAASAAGEGVDMMATGSIDFGRHDRAVRLAAAASR